MDMVRSADGTQIAFEQRGEGTPVILIGGAVNDRSTVAGLAEVLADTNTTIAYDRRGRGESGDAAPYAVERELEDLAALIEHVGGKAALFGHSSGAILALEAAAAGLPVDRVSAYEPPYIVGGREPMGADIVERAKALVAAGDREGVVTLFLTEGAATPAPVVEQMKNNPVWDWFTGLAHTLPYDLALSLPGLRAEHLAKIAVPVLLLAGSATPQWMLDGARAAASAIPGARYEVLDGQDHGILNKPAELRAVLTTFHAAARS